VSREHPGCYGLPTAISASSLSCRVCPERVGCGYEAFVLLESLPNNPLTQRERLALALSRRALASSPQTNADQVSTSTRGIQRGALSESQLGEIATLPTRVATQVHRLTSLGWFDFAKQELRAGRNPARKGWQRIFCELLLAGGASSATLELALVERMGLMPGSAKAQVSMGMSIFAAGRIATRQFGQFTLLPN